ncbi:MAG: peptidase E [Planctomycetota bacterium]
MPEHQIIALGGGGFSMEESTLLDDSILAAARTDTPSICFVGTASGDSEVYRLRFYQRFGPARCTCTHLPLFNRTIADLEDFACSQDIIYVGGGNTANMLAVWRLHSFDTAIRAAYERGTVLAGVSAGSICWFEHGVTDSFGTDLQGMTCLGLLPGSNCPHYDGEPNRRPTYHRLVAEGMPGGLAADDGVALHYVDGELHRIVSSREGASAYRVELGTDGVTESGRDTTYLGDA